MLSSMSEATNYGIRLNQRVRGVNPARNVGWLRRISRAKDGQRSVTMECQSDVGPRSDSACDDGRTRAIFQIWNDHIGFARAPKILCTPA